jgi:hypothetical protein
VELGSLRRFAPEFAPAVEGVRKLGANGPSGARARQPFFTVFVGLPPFRTVSAVFTVWPVLQVFLRVVPFVDDTHSQVMP